MPYSRLDFSISVHLMFTIVSSLTLIRMQRVFEQLDESFICRVQSAYSVPCRERTTVKTATLEERWSPVTLS